MADLDKIESDVSNLDQDESPLNEFRDVFKEIEAAGKATGDQEIDRLRDILSDFRGKLPDKIILKSTRVASKDLADTLMLQTLNERIGHIDARNQALSRLTTELDTQIAKANADAERLKTIKDAMDKAAKTVEQAKTLVDQLTATDTSVKTKLKNLIDGLANVSSIFAPEDT